jgi:Domain of unknown function (DUF4331)
MRLRLSRAVRLVPAFLLALAIAGCNGDEDEVAGPEAPRMYNQIQRLGNPLVSEVFLAKRSHPTHGAIGPAQDVAQIGAEFRSFVLTVAGRSESVANTLQAVLLPDMLIVQTDKPTTSAGWLSWALADGWGGRKLDDDVVDAGLMALFGPLLDPNNVSPSLTTDNVASDSQFLTSFPYVGTPN